MSSHREAPEISKDPVADNTDVYAFVSPDNPSTVTIIANYIPLRGAGGRPELLRVRRRRPLLDLHRQRRRRQARHQLPLPVHGPRSRNPNTFLYNTGPIGSLDDPNWNRRQFYNVTRTDGTHRDKRARREPRLARRATSARARRRTTRRSRTPRSTTLGSGEKVFAGQRNDGVLRRPRRDLRPRRPAAVPEPAPDPDRRRRTSVDTLEHAQRPLDRDPGADRRS